MHVNTNKEANSSKSTSFQGPTQLNQNGTQEKAQLSGSVFHAPLACGLVTFALTFCLEGHHI